MGDEIERFIYAAEDGNLQEVENLLRNGFDPSVHDNYGILNEI